MIKQKVEPPPVPAQKQQTNNQTHLRINAEVDARLDKFIAANQDLVGTYRELVTQYPERAVRKLALNTMLRHEDKMKLVEKEMPQVKQWVDQTPGMMERIMEKIKNVNPFYRERAFVSEAKRQKTRLDFRPPATGVKISAG